MGLGAEVSEVPEEVEKWMREHEGIQLTRKLGSGRDASVYDAHSSKQQQGAQQIPPHMSAVKIAASGCLRILQHEARVLETLSAKHCPGVPCVLSRNLFNDQPARFPYIQLERCGHSLAALPIALGEEALVDVGIELLRILEHVHRRGVVHADIKPANIVASSDAIFSSLCSTNAGHMLSSLKIIDFAIARGPALADANDSATIRVHSPAHGVGKRADSSYAPYHRSTDGEGRDASSSSNWNWGVPPQSALAGSGGEFGSSRYSSPYAMDREALTPLDDLYSLLYTLVHLSGHRLAWSKEREQAKHGAAATTAATESADGHRNLYSIIKNKKLAARDDPQKLLDDREDHEAFRRLPAPLVRFVYCLRHLDCEGAVYDPHWYSQLKRALASTRIPGHSLEIFNASVEESQSAVRSHLQNMLATIVPPELAQQYNTPHSQVNLMRHQLLERFNMSPRLMLDSIAAMLITVGIKHQTDSNKVGASEPAFHAAKFIGQMSTILQFDWKPAIDVRTEQQQTPSAGAMPYYSSKQVYSPQQQLFNPQSQHNQPHAYRAQQQHPPAQPQQHGYMYSGCASATQPRPPPPANYSGASMSQRPLSAHHPQPPPQPTRKPGDISPRSASRKRPRDQDGRANARSPQKRSRQEDERQLYQPPDDAAERLPAEDRNKRAAARGVAASYMAPAAPSSAPPVDGVKWEASPSSKGGSHDVFARAAEQIHSTKAKQSTGSYSYGNDKANEQSQAAADECGMRSEREAQRHGGEYDHAKGDRAHVKHEEEDNAEEGEAVQWRDETSAKTTNGPKAAHHDDKGLNEE